MKQIALLFICMLLSMTFLLTPDALAQSSNSSDKLEDAVGEILRNSEVTAGLEVIKGCGVKESRIFTPSTGTTEERLNHLVQSEKALTWSKVNERSYRAAIRYSSDIRVTSIRVSAKHIEARTLTLATDFLLGDPSVQSEIGRLGYTYFPGEIGFSPIHTEKRIIDLPAGTLGDDLMVLAAKFGPSVWQLDQHTCGNIRTFRVEWIRG